MTGLDRLRISLLRGWTIPRAMEWLFWPIDYVPAERDNIVPLARKFFEVRLPDTKGFWERANELAAADARAAGRMANRRA